MSTSQRFSAGFILVSLALSFFASFFIFSIEAYAAKFTIGERVQVSSGPLNVRAKASLSDKILGTQPTGALGTIVEGPKSSGGYIWWKVNYDTGVDGWSIENYLMKAVTSAPSAPANLFAASGDAVVGLGWTASTGATSYTVKRSTTSGGPYANVTTGVVGTSYGDTGLTNGTIYYYVVSAVNSAGASANSAQVSATPVAPTTSTTVTTTTTALSTVTYEAENMTKVNYLVDTANSGYVKLSADGATGSLSANFSGGSGTYNVRVSVLLESDGQSTLDFSKDGTQVHRYTYPLGTAVATYDILNVSLNNNAAIKLTAIGNAGSLARVDKLVFTQVTSGGTVTTTTSTFAPMLFQAELMTLLSPMVKGTDSNALGGSYISPSTGTNSTSPTRKASVSLNVASAGTYYLWARIMGPTTSSDALYLGMNTSWARTLPSTTGVYQWVKVPVGSGSTNYGFTLPQGTNTIQVGYGEIGTRLDAVYLTNSASDVPTFAPTTSTTVTTTTTALSTVTYEAENMTKVNYLVDTANSGYVKLSADGATGSLSANFSGGSGTYNVRVSVLLESDGQSTLDFSKDGTQVHRYTYPLGTAVAT